MADVYIEKVNEIWCRIHAEPHIMVEMSERFTFEVPGARFTPAYRNKMWDGKIRLLSLMTGRIYAGLKNKIVEWCNSQSYSVEFAPEFIPQDSMSVDDVHTFGKFLDVPYDIRDYQANSVSSAISLNRALFVSPTASGKSFIIYLITRYHTLEGRKVLIIVPSVTLVSQMDGDFTEYNNDTPMGCHLIKAGADKNLEADITITTWQSVYKMGKEFFSKFDVIIGDEAHNFKSKSLLNIMENTPDVQYRYGFTGTLDGSKTNELTLEGIFGERINVSTTEKLINDGTLADFDVKALVFDYPPEECFEVKDMTYQEEISFIISNERRNKYIANLAQNIPGNTLILFNFVEKHGKVLLPILKESGEKPVHFIHGDISGEERERIRKLMEESDGVILLASYGTFSTGSNVKKLDNLIFASPSKSKIRVLQSIGRILRKGNGKVKSTLYDIADNLKTNKENYALKHFRERLNIYKKENFLVKIFRIKI